MVARLSLPQLIDRYTLLSHFFDFSRLFNQHYAIRFATVSLILSSVLVGHASLVLTSHSHWALSCCSPLLHGTYCSNHSPSPCSLIFITYRLVGEYCSSTATHVYTWSQNLLEHSGMTHALINNTVSIFIVRVELCYLSSHAQCEPPLSLSSTISNHSIHYSC